MKIRALIGCMRMRQWMKNILIFAALIFSSHAHQLSYVGKSIAAFFLFSLCAGAIYTFNDIIDLASDREHPVKKYRPLASGRVSVRAAWIFFVLVGSIALIGSFLFDPAFGWVVAAYILLQIFYTLKLKNIVIVDVLVVSFSFLIRIIAGGIAIHVPISNWILVCTMFLALFLALAKRRHELVLLETNAGFHRTILREYSPYLLDQMISVVTSATLVAYTIFTLSEETTMKFGKMILTVPFVLYGIFRYLYLVHMKDKGGHPEETLLTDIPLQITIFFYGIVVLVIIYF